MYRCTAIISIPNGLLHFFDFFFLLCLSFCFSDALISIILSSRSYIFFIILLFSAFSSYVFGK